MAACDVGRMCLFIRSVLWDLKITQEAATITYEDNGGCTAMGNTQKPTNRTHHINIKYFALCKWIELNLIHLECVDTAINTADHLTKALTCTLFHQHADYLLGHVSPRYSPAYETIVNTFVQTPANNPDKNIFQYAPTLFTTPSTVTANRTSMPSHEDVKDNPWLPIILWNEDYN